TVYSLGNWCIVEINYNRYDNQPILSVIINRCGDPQTILSFPTRRSSDLAGGTTFRALVADAGEVAVVVARFLALLELFKEGEERSEEHTSELQSRENLVCRLLLEKKKIDEILI